MSTSPRTSRLLFASLAVALVSAACTLLNGLDGYAGPPEESPAEAGVDSGRDAGADVVDGAVDALVEAAGPPCTSDAGSDLVPIGDGLCIDRREVTVGDYRVFLTSRAGDVSGQRADCAANTDLLPMGGLPLPASDALPVRYVDFCDALAYCDWAGKRLCGAIDGSRKAFDAGIDPTVSEWFRACSPQRRRRPRLPLRTEVRRDRLQLVPRRRRTGAEARGHHANVRRRLPWPVRPRRQRRGVGRSLRAGRRRDPLLAPWRQLQQRLLGRLHVRARPRWSEHEQ